jgi:peroxiredoxin
MNKVRFLTIKVLFASVFLSLNFVFCNMFLLFATSNLALANTFSINYNEVSNLKNKQKVDNFFNLVSDYNPILEPKVELELPNGNKAMLKDYRGKLLILYFWATWCNGCFKELSALEKLKENLLYREITDIDILTVTVDFKSWERVQTALRQNNIKNIALAADRQKSLMSEMGVKSLPTVFIINKDGYVLLRHEGQNLWDDEYMTAKLIELKDKYAATSGAGAKKENDRPAQSDIISQHNSAKSKTIIIN